MDLALNNQKKKKTNLYGFWGMDWRSYDLRFVDFVFFGEVVRV